MAQLEFDERLAKRMDLLYRSRDYVRRRRLVHAALDARAGERVLDVGCGPGFYTSELLDRVGDDGAVVAVDASPAMLALAAHRCDGRANVSFHEADAGALPVADESFDRALSVQVFEYLTDLDAPLRELHRALRPGGRALVWDIDWATLSMRSADPARLDRTLRAWDEHLADPCLPRTLAPRLRAAGFADVVMDGHAFVTGEFGADAFGSAVVPLIEEYVASVDGIGPEGARAWADEQRELGERGEFYFACIQFCFTATRPG